MTQIFVSLQGLLHRMMGLPLETAAQWWKQVAEGKVPNAYEHGLSVAPEAVGSAAGTVLAGELAGKGLEAAGKTAGKIVRSPETTRLLREGTGEARVPRGATVKRSVVTT
jgi:hypothetical protein